MIYTSFIVFVGITTLCNLIAALRRHNVFLIIASLNTTILSSVLLISVLASLNQDVGVLTHAYVLIFLTALINIVFCGVAILIFRTRGTLRLDDFRELRG